MIAPKDCKNAMIFLPLDPKDEEYYDDDDDSNEDTTNYYSNWKKSSIIVNCEYWRSAVIISGEQFLTKFVVVQSICVSVRFDFKGICRSLPRKRISLVLRLKEDESEIVYLDCCEFQKFFAFRQNLHVRDETKRVVWDNRLSPRLIRGSLHFCLEGITDPVTGK